MSKSKFIHIEEGEWETKYNKDFHLLQESTWIEKTLDSYIEEGYRIIHMFPDTDTHGFFVYLQLDE